MKIQTKRFLCFEIAAVMLAIVLSLLSVHLSAENSSPSSSSSDNRPPPGGRPAGPPPEAVQACAEKVSGVACSFVGREGTAIEGQCFGPPPAPRETTAPAPTQSTSGNSENRNSNSALACRPKHGTPPPSTSKPTQ